ncbi:MAG: hypothetical protein WCF18_16515, partial [Chthoniobacteraceae bacterium]
FGGGNFNVIGTDVAATNTTEALGNPTFARGYNVITVTAQGGNQANVTLGTANDPSTVQNSGTTNVASSVLFRGTSLGTAAGANIATITGTFVPGGSTGAIGANTRGILPWGIVETTAAGTGATAQFATGEIGTTTFTGLIRPLNTSTEMATATTFTANVNQRVTGSASVTAAVTPNSITLESGGGVTINPFINLSLASGGILSKAGNTGINGGIITQANTARALNFWAVGNTNVTSLLNGGNGTATTNVSLSKAGAGILTLTTPTSALAAFSGMSVNSLSGLTAINQGTLKLAGGKNTIQPGNFLEISTDGVLDLNGTSQQVLGLFSDGAVSGAGGSVINSAGTAANLVINQDNAARNWAGTISGNVQLTRSGQNNLSIYSPQTYTGATLINGGTNILRDDASLGGPGAIGINYATLTADNNTSTVDVGDRIDNAKAITLRGGTLTFQGRAATNSSETVGLVTLAEGLNTINNSTGGTGINSSTLTLGAGSLVRPVGSTATLRFNNLGTMGLSGSNPRTFITGGVALTNNIIGPWALVDREYASYSTDCGIGGLNQVGFAGYSSTPLNGSPLATDNVRLGAAGTSNIIVDTTVNTLTFASQTTATTLNLGGNTLTVAGGGLLLGQATANVDFAITNGNLTSGAVGVGGDFYLTQAAFGTVGA